MGTFSGKVVVWPGMFHTIQCKLSSEVLFNDRSTSCIQSTKLCVPAGTLVQVRSGETALFPATWVYFKGMTVPSAKAVVVSTIGTGRTGCWAKATDTAVKSAVKASDIFFIFIGLVYNNSIRKYQ